MAQYKCDDPHDRAYVFAEGDYVPDTNSTGAAGNYCKRTDNKKMHLVLICLDLNFY
jgi:hypothetical protein